MSQSTYNKLWAEAQKELSELLSQELPSEPFQPERDRVVFFQRLITLYVHYIRIFRKLEEAYDNIIHPQKRRLIRSIIDGVMGRLVELKSEMVEVEYSEYHYMDDVIQDLKLTPEDLEIPIPKYFISERHKVLQERAAVLSGILEQHGLVEKPKPTVTRSMSLEEAVRIIQVAERARQGRLRTKIMREIQSDSQIQSKTKDNRLEHFTVEQAAIQIQKMWKGYFQRKRTKKEREEEMIFLGMCIKDDVVQSRPSVGLSEEKESVKRKRMEEIEEDYQKALISIPERLRETEGPDMKETMKDQITLWFNKCHNTTGSLPDYPSEAEGGSAVIFANEQTEELDEQEDQKPSEKDVPKGKNQKEKDVQKGKKEKEKVEEEEKETGLVFRPSAFLSDLQTCHIMFTEVWQNRDESMNFSQTYDAELIKEEKRKELKEEIRLQVDEQMRQELEKWKLALEGKKSKPAKKKTKASKGEKKKKKEIDLTADRSPESLYEELVVEGILKPANNVKLHDFIGGYSHLGTTLRQTDIEPMPSLSDVRQVIALNAILPLGSPLIHEKTPVVKSMLLAGPSGVGKKMLVHAVCQETGANLFDLSASNLVGKYPGKNGLQMLLHLVFKVARLMQPSVMWIRDAEKMFNKKLSKEDKQLDPKRLKKDLLKMLKSVIPGDRILLIGTTNNPVNTDLNALCTFYTKIILIPRPDYASRYVMWKELIHRNRGVLTSALDLSSLAKISDGYTQGHMMHVVQEILTEHRIRQLVKRPLTDAEFILPLAAMDPVFQEEEEALKNWYAKTPLGKKRAAAALGMDGVEGVADKVDKDEKKKKKK